MLFSPFERRAFGPVSLSGFDGWLVKPVRARSLYERLASEFAPAAAPPPPTAVPSARRGRAKRALLAEDNDINALVAQKALRRLGFEVERARDGEEASRLAVAASRGATPRFDVVLMDIKMPGVDGLRGGAAHPPRRSRGEGAARRDRRADRQRHDRGRRRRDRGGVRRIPRQAGRGRAARSDDRGPARRARGRALGARSACHKSVRQE